MEYTMNERRITYINILNGELSKRTRGMKYNQRIITACCHYLAHKPKIRVQATVIPAVIQDVTKATINAI